MYLTAREARNRLRISRDTLSKLIYSGELKASKIGDSRVSPWRIHEDDLRDFMERRAVRSTAS
jgi:excisionase family DNA binding protein